ncbi:hypothetical protein BDW74DRAFT_2837 [Aspergillus multicolor]|uniref:uncharacterized protein n=1 Tax=Aspergillus multicolor TaxID=41759 RepID=UPI003CCDEC1B
MHHRRGLGTVSTHSACLLFAYLLFLGASLVSFFLANAPETLSLHITGGRQSHLIVSFRVQRTGMKSKIQDGRQQDSCRAYRDWNGRMAAHWKGTWW